MNIKFSYHIIFLTIAMLIGYTVLGQQAVIKVVDLKTGEPVLFAHVLVRSLKSEVTQNGVTDMKGQVEFELNAKSVVSVSYVGYESAHDTINPGRHIIIELKPTAFNMGEYVVTAQYSPQRADKSIYKVKVIGSKQIEQQGATNLAQIFTHELGITLDQNGVFGSNMSIRGMGGENLKVLIDGVPVIGRLDGNLDLGQLNVNNADHIEMVEGPMSVIYGSNALGGVVNIITKENKNVPFTATVNGYYENIGTYNINGTVSASRKRNVIGLSGGRNFFEGYSTNPDERPMFWKPKRQYFVDGYYVYNHPNYKIKYASQYFNEYLLDRGDVIEPLYAFDNHITTVRFNNSLNYSTKIGTKRFVNVLAAYSIYDRKRNTWFKNLHTLEESLADNDGDQDTTRFDAIVVRAELSKSADDSKFNYQLGIDINVDNGWGGKINGTKQIGDYAAFLSVKYNPIHVLSIQPGMRLIYNTRYQAPLVYSINIKYDWTEHFTLRGSYARGFRAPSLKELYLYFVDVNHNVRGNPNLEAEDSHNVLLVAGYSKEQGKTTYGFDVDLFYNHINNAIDLVAVGANDGLYTYRNLYQYISQGFQIDLFYNLYPHFEWKIGLAETGRKNYFDEDIEEYNSFFYSTDVNTNFVYYFPSVNMNISLFYKYTGKLNLVYEDDEGVLQDGYMDPYNNLDISLGKSFFKKTLQLTTGVKNLLNVQSVDARSAGVGHSGGGSGARNVNYGRTFFVSLSYNFQKF